MTPTTPLPRPFRCLNAGTAALAALLLATSLPAHAQEDEWQRNAATESHTHYLTLGSLRSFYKFTTDTQDRRNGTRSISNGTTTLTFGPGERELFIGSYRCQLSHPMRKDKQGELLISKTDVVKLIDPVLRPTYIINRREVKTVIIDPGHGGHDVGQQTPQVREADCVLSLARQLATQLRQRGYEVALTREDNQYLSDQQRIDRANSPGNAIFLSLHLNSGRSDQHGIETYSVAPYIPSDNASTLAGQEGTTGTMPGNEQDGANTALAFALQSSLINSTGAQDGGCRRARYSLLSSLRCPAAIVELGYATHEQEAAALNTEEYRATLATALANGVDTFAQAIKPGATPPVTAAPPPPPPTPVKVDKLDNSSGKTTTKAKDTKRKTQPTKSSNTKKRKSNWQRKTSGKRRR